MDITDVYEQRGEKQFELTPIGKKFATEIHGNLEIAFRAAIKAGCSPRDIGHLTIGVVQKLERETIKRLKDDSTT